MGYWTKYRIISEFPDYVISKDGVVENIQTGKVIKSDRQGYVYVSLRKDGKTHHRSVRKLVYKAFPGKKTE